MGWHKGQTPKIPLPMVWSAKWTWRHLSYKSPLKMLASEFKSIVLSHQELEPCLQSLAVYCTNEDMYCKRKSEEMLFADLSRGHRDDI